MRSGTDHRQSPAILVPFSYPQPFHRLDDDYLVLYGAGVDIFALYYHVIIKANDLLYIRKTKQLEIERDQAKAVPDQQQTSPCCLI